MKKLFLAMLAWLATSALAFSQSLPNPTFIPAWNNHGTIPLLSNNLSDLPSQPTARSNLGLGALAILNTLPVPAPTVLGGIKSLTCSTNQFVNAVDTSGNPTCATPTTGSSTAAAGSTGQFQTNSSGSLAGVTISGDFTINGATGVGTLSTVPITKGGTGVTTLPSGLLKGAGTSAITAGVAGTDYLTPTGSGAALIGLTASQSSFTGTGTAPKTRTVNGKLDTDLITTRDYANVSTDATCAVDTTTGLQNGFDKAGVGGEFKVTKGYWCYTQLTVQNGLKVQCEPGGYLVKIGATGDGIIGNNTLPATLDDVVFRDCIGLTKTGVTPTSGSWVHFKNPRHVTFDNTFIGTRTLSNGGTTKHSYNGFEFEGVDGVTLIGSGVWGSVNDCLLAYGTSTSFNSELRLTAHTQWGGCTQKAQHIAGGLGGVYCESVDEVLSGVGTYFDRTVYNVTNREFFPSLGCMMDSNTSHGFFFAANSIQTIRGAPWAASNGGDGLQVASPQDTTNTHIQIFGAHLYGNATHGLDIQAGHVGVTGGTFFNNGTSGAGSGILLFGSGVQSAHVEAVRTYLNHDYGVDNQANDRITSFGPIYATEATPWRSVNALRAPLMPLPTTCTSQPTGGLRNNAGAVNVC